MRRLEEYTNVELLALSADQISRLIDQECAVEGIELLPKAPERVEPVSEAPSEVFYEVSGHLFADQAVAQELSDWLLQHSHLDTYYLDGRWSGPQAVQNREEPHFPVTLKKYWDANRYQLVRREMEQHKEALEEYNRVLREFNRINSQRENVRLRVSEAIQAAVREEETHRCIRQTFAEYVELADGNEELALGFLLKVKKWDKGLVHEVLGRVLPEEEATDGDEETRDS